MVENTKMAMVRTDKKKDAYNNIFVKNILLSTSEVFWDSISLKKWGVLIVQEKDFLLIY